MAYYGSSREIATAEAAYSPSQLASAGDPGRGAIKSASVTGGKHTITKHDMTWKDGTQIRDRAGRLI